MKTNHTSVNKINDTSYMIHFDLDLDSKLVKEAVDVIRRAANVYITETLLKKLD